MWNGVVTNLGLSLLEQWAAGSETLYIDKATAGSGTVAQSNMRGSTYVQGEVGDVSIVASIPVTGGTQYRIQVSANPDAAYIMHQVGIWAHLGASGGTTLLALYQDEDGVSVPLEADDPGFGFTLYAVVSMSNQGSVSVNFDGGAYVTRDDFSSALAGYVKTVNGNGPNSNGNVTLPTDTTPTKNSSNYITSGGVYTEAGNLAAGMAILANNNTHAAIASGRYVYVRGHSTLAEGLYTANAAIAANATLSTSNLTAVSGGGLNSLLSEFTNWTSFDAQIYDLDTSTGVSFTYAYYTKIGNLVFMCGRGISSAITISTSFTIKNLPCSRVWAGGIYLNAFSGNGADRTIQSSTSGALFRPNLTGSIISNQYHTFWLIGQA